MVPAVVAAVILIVQLAAFYFISQDIDGIFVGWLAGVALSVLLIELILGISIGGVR